jgi:hypothetical protein
MALIHSTSTALCLHCHKTYGSHYGEACHMDGSGGYVPSYIDTTWKPASYDVWGNARDGYEVNDVYRGSEVTIRCKVEINNADTPQEFLSAYPSNTQIRAALNLRRFKLELDGDDISIYVNRARDGYPLGELSCTSHDSLSPIRARDTVTR